MGSESPVILVDLPFCYLNYDHQVRKQIRKIVWTEKQRWACKAAYAAAVKLAFQKEFFRFEDLAQ
jgi:hypothetical protein